MTYAATCGMKNLPQRDTGFAVRRTTLGRLLVCSLSVVAALPAKPVMWQDTHMIRALQVLHDSCY